MNKNLQIVIPHIARNNEILKKNIPYIIENLSPTKIIILTKKETIDTLKNCFSNNNMISFVDEDSVIPKLTYEYIESLLTQENITTYRTGWYFQQFLKLAWALNNNSSEWYLTWDSDTIPLKNIHFFDNQKPVFIKKYEYNKPYFETIHNLLNLEKQNDFSFISECMLFNSAIVKEIIYKIESNDNFSGEQFFEKIVHSLVKTTNSYCAFSEFETYGTYVTQTYPSLYTFKEIKACRYGARLFGLNPNKEDLFRMKKKFDTISFERWHRKISVYIFFQKCLSKVFYKFTNQNSF